MVRPIHVLNGPNLNLLGLREPHIYGHTTLAQIETMCRDAARGDLFFGQTNHEGQMVDWIHEARETAGGIIINPAGLSFHSVAVLDALNTFEGPKIELHISNIHARDEAHRHSLLSQAVTAVIAGLGAKGYPVAVGAMYGAMGD
ncbi:type II 3-dehydroquinate dehydratase [Pseudoprimorskyibacter insulae]|uniref:3-dehydroquinate dehydratase n=1 Tax=Pseudoprimorskyibacter insulae TaxID=1695997 RepID=A0A2R8AY07_9RHOB|nr:type II 3-dehydroquinate dehydratase [Pseudoprimorskyibacter insulae]SPF80925.1 3-dehydroquinate dehydratase [Pseudoprimorskyibacter insulae]